MLLHEETCLMTEDERSSLVVVEIFTLMNTVILIAMMVVDIIHR